MTDFYVSQNGAGAGDGTSRADAWAYANISWGAIQAGDRLIVIGLLTQTFNVGAHNGTIDNYVEIWADEVVDPGRIEAETSGINSSRAFTRILGLQATSTTASGVFVGANGSNIELRDLILDGAVHAASFASTAQFTNIVIDGGVYLGQQNGISRIINSNGNPTTGLTIRNADIRGVGVTGTTGFGIRWDCNLGNDAVMDQVLIENNTIHDCGLNACRIGMLGGGIDEQGAIDVNGSIILRRNTVVRNGTDGGGGGGLAPRSFASQIIEYNNCSYNVAAGGGINTFDSTGTIIRYNECSHNRSSTIDGCGILLDHNNPNAQVYGNTCSDNIGIEGVHNSGMGVGWLANCGGARIYSNVGRGNKHGLYSGGGEGRETPGLVAENNVFLECITSGAFSGSGILDGVTLRRNVFTGVAGANGVDNSRTQSSGNFVLDRNCLDGFDTDYVQQTPGANDILADPKLLGWRPLPDSPTVGAGGPAPLPPEDYDRKPFTNSNIGAFTDALTDNTLFAVVTDTAAQPSADQIIRGDDANDNLAAFSGLTEPAQANVQLNAVGLTPDTVYWTHWVQVFEEQVSNIVTSTQFRTLPAIDDIERVTVDGRTRVTVDGRTRIVLGVAA